MRRVERWLFAPSSAERLAAVRAGLCAVLALRLTRGIYVDLAGQPAALFRPRSFMIFLDAMPPRGVVIALQITGILAAALAAVGMRARLTLPVAWACGVFLNGMVTSNGKIMHNDVLLLLCMVPLLIARSSDAWSLDARHAPERPRPSAAYGWPVHTAMVVVAGAYFFTGLAKLMNSGLAWATSGNMRWLMYASSDSQAGPNQVALLIADNAWLAHVVAAGTLALELAFPIVLWRARLTPLFVAGALGLHGGIWLTMRLDYSAMAASVLIVLTDWPAVLRRVGARRGSSALAARAVGLD